MAYTPLKTGQAAAYGYSGDAVKALQTQFNTQNAGVAGYVPLKVDGLYGPLTQAASQFKAPTVTTPTTPVYKTATVPQGTAESADTIAARKAQADYLATLNAPDENKIYQDTLSKFQAQIDATNNTYADELSRAKVTGAGRLGTQTAISARRGLIGSDFGEASTVAQEQGNEEVYKSIENERLAKVNAILTQAKSDASADIRAKREEFTKGLDARLAFYSEADARKVTNTGKAIKSLIAQGLSPKDIDPKDLRQIASYYGVSVDDITAGYDDTKSAYDAEQEKSKLETSKTQAEIDKINADIAKGKIIELSEGGMLYDTTTGKTFKNPKTFAPSSGRGSSPGGIYDMLDYRTANAVISQGNNFGTSDVVKKYNNIVAASNLIRGVDPNTTNPAEHQAVVYNFAKALDPDSVVREGEYATVKKYSQSLLNKYGGEIKQAIAGKGFLSSGAIQAIQDATDNRIKAYEPQYKNLRNETKNRINSIAGKDVADLVLLDYDQGYSGNQAEQPQSMILNGQTLYLQADGTYE